MACLVQQNEAFTQTINGFVAAYPEDIFHEPTKEEYARAHELLDQIRPGFGSVLHGSWGRHIAKRIKETLKDL